MERTVKTKAFTGKAKGNISLPTLFVPAILLLTLMLPPAVLSQQPDIFQEEQVLNLEELRSLVLEKNREVQVSEKRMLSAHAVRKASYTQFLPSFDFSSQYLRMNKPFNLLSSSMFLPVVPHQAITSSGTLNPMDMLQADPAVLVTGPDGSPITDADGNFVFRHYAYLPQSAGEVGQSNNILLNLSLAQPIYTGGKIRAQYRGAGHLEALASYSREVTQAEVLLEAETYFWKLLTVQHKQELAGEYIRMLESMVKDLENYLEEGLVNHNDVLQARVALNEAEMEKVKADHGIITLSMALNRMTGLALNQKIVAKEELDFTIQEFNLDELWRKGIENRPELSMAREKAGLAGAMADGAKAGKYPNLAFGASYIAANPNPYNGLEKEFGHDWFVGLTLTMPVYHWGERRQIHKAALLEEQAQQIMNEDTRELIKLDITAAYLEYVETNKTIETRRLSADQARENLEMVRDNFEVGTVKPTELMEAQILWYQALTNLIESKADRKEKYAALEKAVGTTLP